jgi:hypothetical protein
MEGGRKKESKNIKYTVGSSVSVSSISSRKEKKKKKERKWMLPEYRDKNDTHSKNREGRGEMSEGAENKIGKRFILNNRPSVLSVF